MKANPLTPKEKQDLSQASTKCRNNIQPYRFSVGPLNKSKISIPPLNYNPDLIVPRKKLPIYQYRENILETIEKNQVIVISGETGSGKTTQVPQYLLEDACLKQKGCRIICCQPRRLSAISVAERVAVERNEAIGQAVGYQIRLESRTSPTSNLIYCTNGVFIRCLMGGGIAELMSNITHIIIDEVHERDKFSDFLLISLKEGLHLNPNIKIILMSATIDSDLFTKYFNDCPLIQVPGRMYDVETFYLDSVLALIGYKHPQVDAMMKTIGQQAKNGIVQKKEVLNSFKSKQNIFLDDETTCLVNDTLANCFMNESDEEFLQFFYLVEGENIPVDYKHNETDMTALMIASFKGFRKLVEALLELGADAQIVTSHGYTALDFAEKANHMDCVAALKTNLDGKKTVVEKNFETSKVYEQVLLEVYQSIGDRDQYVDHHLLAALIKTICNTMPAGSILCFLPGYDDIIQQNDTLSSMVSNAEIEGIVKIYTLHSNMQTGDQKNVFQPAPFNTRKIILSTNIAETSITIDDVVYVIDSGKVKEKSYDAISNTTSLAAQWTSQACGKQRSGRAGRTRPGICYRLYSSTRYEAMDKFTLPEMLRVPLTEMCLTARLIAPESQIVDFLAKAINPPAAVIVKQSIKLLKQIGALDDDENLTQLGVILADLPVDAKLGKVLIYAIILKCIDPVLTIVSVLSVKDPFILPNQISERGKALEAKKRLSEDSLSDHMTLLRAFQKWIDNKSCKREKYFCNEHFISSGSMDTINAVRSQIIGHLRAIGLIKSHGPGNITDLNRNSNNWAIVKSCLTAALYPNICRVDRKGDTLKTRLETKIVTHPSSVLTQKNFKKSPINAYPTDWLIFEEKSRSAGRLCLIKGNTVVSAVTVALFSGPIHMLETNLVQIDDDSSDSECEETGGGYSQNYTQFILDDWINFTTDTDGAYFLFNLRQKFNALFAKFIINPKNYYQTCDLSVIKIIATVLLEEDRAANLPQPQTVGDRPKAVGMHFAENSRNYDYNYYNDVNHRMSSMNFSNDRPSSSKAAAAYTAKNPRPIKKSNSTYYQQTPQQNYRKPANINYDSAFYFTATVSSDEQVNRIISGVQKKGLTEFISQQLINLSKINPLFSIILFLNTQSKFYGAVRFLCSDDGYILEPISTNSVPYDDVR